MDYPELVSKLNILISAGLTIKASLNRIVHDYDKNHPNHSRYLYKELKVSLLQLQNGSSEGLVYSQFGQRLGIPCYIKFGSLLEQNLRKGTKELSYLLSTEVCIANNEKKHSLLKRGEEASTKLLMPMMLMFLSILILVLFPAFFNISL